MRLIVGLGNPGPEYQWTPHNLGFLAVDEIANRASIRVERPEGKALVGLGKVAGEEVVLAKPQTYMNLSGISVRDLLEKYELGPDHPVSDLAAYVLRPMKKADLEVAAEMVATAGDAVEMILTQGIATAMNKYNRRVPPAEENL